MQGVEIKSIVIAVGLFLSVAGVVFLFKSLDLDSAKHVVEKIGGGRLILASAVYAVSIFALFLAWRACLPKVSGVSGKLALLAAVFSVSQLAKYIPGGVFQYASRQVELGRLQYGQGNIARGSIAEILSQLAAASAISGVFLSVFSPPVVNLGLPETLERFAAILPILLLLFSVGCIIIGRWVLRHGQIWRAFALHIFFFTAMGVISTAAALPLLDNKIPLLYVSGTFVLAWMAGFLVIGSPGGLGVREAALIILLQHQIGIDSSGALAVLSRMISTLGDLGFAAVTLGWQKIRSRG